MILIEAYALPLFTARATLLPRLCPRRSSTRPFGRCRHFARASGHRRSGPHGQRQSGFNNDMKRGRRVPVPTASQVIIWVSSRRRGTAHRRVVLDDVNHLVHQPLVVLLLQHDEGGVAFNRPDSADPSAFKDANIAAPADVRRRTLLIPGSSVTGVLASCAS